MKNLWLIGWLMLASGCSSYSVHCGKHLHPINAPTSSANASDKSSDHP